MVAVGGDVSDGCGSVSPISCSRFRHVSREISYEVIFQDVPEISEASGFYRPDTFLHEAGNFYEHQTSETDGYSGRHRG